MRLIIEPLPDTDQDETGLCLPPESGLQHQADMRHGGIQRPQLLQPYF